MNENIDLTKILDGCPYGTEFYHLIFGQVALKEIINGDYPIILEPINNSRRTGVTKEGRLYKQYDGECVLYPSKYQRDWSKFKRFWDKPEKRRFDVNTLQPFDKVLAKDGFSSTWTCTFFSHMDNDVSFPVYCSGGYFKVCIPYNEETKHLVGTKEDCPKFYKWWKE